MHIVADDRERASGVLEHLKNFEGLILDMVRLPTGDYCADDYLLFERKTFVDFARSIRDGRLFEQAARLAADPRTAIVILEGTAVDLASLGTRREALQGALITLSVIYGIPVLRSLGAEETARLIYYTAHQVGRVVEGATVRHGYRPHGKRKLQLHILQGLPGVGPRRAEQLLDALGTVEKVMTADHAQLTAVEGIGPTTAEAIRWAVRERADPVIVSPGDIPL
jgi:ERCC4-type nuclease